jgi:hypothetical protein
VPLVAVVPVNVPVIVSVSLVNEADVEDTVVRVPLVGVDTVPEVFVDVLVSLVSLNDVSETVDRVLLVTVELMDVAVNVSVLWVTVAELPVAVVNVIKVHQA